MELLYLIFHACMKLGFLDVEINPVPAVIRLLCSNMRGLAGNLSDLTVSSSRYDIQLSSVFPDLVDLSCCSEAG